MRNKKMLSLIAAVMVFAVVMVMGTVASSAATSGSARVMMDGKYIEFSNDSLPKNVSGRIMVPYRAIFEYLGLEVGYDQATKEISGKTSDFTLKMKSGDKNITIVYADGTQKTKTMDVAPYISGGRTFVPTRFVSEMLEYTVGWDSANKTVVIVDKNKIIENVNQDFSTLFKLNELNNDKAYEINGDISTDVTASGEKTSAVGKLSGVVKGMDEEFDMNIKVTEADDVQDINAKVKFDSKNGYMYMKGDGITEKNQWMRFNLSSMMNSSEINIQNIIQLASSESLDPKTFIDMVMNNLSEDMTVTSYDEMKAVYDGLKQILGNDAFKKSGNSYKASFNQEINGTKLAGDVTINVNSADKTTDYSFNISADSSNLKLSIDGKSNSSKLDFSMSMDVPDTISMNLKLALDMKETSKNPDISIPSGETSVSVDQLFSDIMKSDAA